MSFDRIPAELQALRQWVIWRYVKRDDQKLTKIPYSPRVLTLASVTDSSTWGTFEEAVACLSIKGVSGIGFVLTAQDDYTFTDLDDPYAKNDDGSPKYSNADELMARQKVIFEGMLSYAELSPSGKGLHIISRGRVPRGKKRHAIEVYSQERYMTMTGNVYRDSAITAQQPWIDWIYGELGGEEASHYIPDVGYQADKEPDDDVLRKAYGAVNGEKFQALFEGRWQDAGLVDNSWSAGDFALIDMLQFFTSSRQQIRRLFFRSGLATRDKASRPGYVENMIDRSFDRQPKGIDVEALLGALDAQRDRETAAREAAAAPRAPIVIGTPPGKQAPPSPYLMPLPGLLGQMAGFIYTAAPRPVPEIAVAGAIGLLAGMAGRCFNVSSTGLNVYILMLAKTGRGKEAIAQGVGRLMAPVKAIDGTGGGVPGADEFLGPQEIASGQALIKYMGKTSRSFVSIISEFDNFLAALTSRNVSPPVAKLKQVLLSAYSRSGKGQRLDKSIYSETDKNIAVIPSPAITLIGEGTPDKFYELLSETLVSDGFLPRFSVVEYEGPRSELNASFASVVPNPELVQSISRLAAHCLGLNAKDAVIDVVIQPDALELLNEFNLECDARINTAINGTVTELWNRAHLKANKLAALIAVGCNWYTPTIDAYAAQWAIDCARHDTTRLAERFETGRVGVLSADASQVVDVKAKLQKLFDRKVDAGKFKLPDQAIAAGIFNNYYLQGAVSNLISFKDDRRGATVAYHALMQSLVRMGVIDEVNRSDRQSMGILGTAYVLKEWDWLRSVN